MNIPNTVMYVVFESGQDTEKNESRPRGTFMQLQLIPLVQSIDMGNQRMTETAKTFDIKDEPCRILELSNPVDVFVFFFFSPFLEKFSNYQTITQGERQQNIPHYHSIVKCTKYVYICRLFLDNCFHTAPL